ncbi:type I polyketide synthase, partial [Streptomyces asoensis]|uniref:type I polyketide synthase n=1 Tax=Streptomyces asoensis TaxID=249586 RepID=UPI0033D8CD0A
LEGPAVTVDTACSSSLVALHLAVQALRSGECTMALAGGVSVMATPWVFVEFSRQRGMAPDGRCKAFAGAADGAGWSEGVGLLLVERLSDARRNGHPVLAVVRGSAVNQDGASNGLTAPNGPSQQRVIRAALANARLTPADVDVVEAHGTGTTLGDPIEAQALLATYGQDRPAGRPLRLGSVKSNIGHTQAAAGAAGVIKMVEAMRHGVLPRTLHVDEPTPHVDWSAGAVELLTDSVEWTTDGTRPLRAGVSSFGISGTNAHVILEEAPEAEEPEESSGDPRLVADVLPWVVSGRSDAALRAQAGRLAGFVEQRSELTVADVARSLVETRSALEHRAVVLAGDRDAAVGALRSVAEGVPVPGVVAGAVSGEQGRVVFVFPGQGSQWLGMGAGLWESSPVFRERLEECDAALSSLVDCSVTDVVRGLPDAASLDDVVVVQASLWAVMVSLAAMWRSVGVEPGAVIGHSQGEIAAAVVAGGLSVEDGARVVVLRARAIAQSLSGHGGMVSLAAGADRVRELIAAWGERISIASVNGPSSTVVSGEPDALDDLMAACDGEGIRARRIAVDYASHSAQVESIREQVTEALEDIEPRAAEVPFYSTVLGSVIDTGDLDAGYWVTNLRQEVRFDATVRELLADGFGYFVECSPHPVLTVGMQETFEDHADAQAVALGTLRRDEGGPERLLTSLAEGYVRGLAVDWHTLFAGTGAQRIELPTYAFRRRRYWLEEPAGAAPKQEAGELDEVDAGFWAAVDAGALETLTTELGVPADEPFSALLPALSSWRGRRREESRADGWRYRVVWRPARFPADRQPRGHWLVVVPEGRADDPWAAGSVRALERAGAGVTRLVVDAVGADRDRLAHVLREAFTEGSGAGSGETPPGGVLSLLALDDAPHPAYPAVPSGLAATVTLVQAMVQAGEGMPAPPRLWCATRGAVSTGASDPLASPAQAHTWGLGRVAALEHPLLWGGLVDLPADAGDTEVARLAAVLRAPAEEDHLAVRGDGVHVRRLVRAPAEAVPAVREWRPRGSVLVTGGTGGIGGHLARRLAQTGAEHLVLVSRSGPEAPGATELAEELTAAGAKVSLVACDVADRVALAAVLASVPADQPLTAVVHAAAVLDDGVIESLDPERMERVLRVKAQGALHLDELTRDADLSAFVLCSSFGATFGLPALGNYAPGNAFLDALAERRRAQGLPATSVAWGTWAGTGMAAGDVGARGRLEGIHEMDPEPASAALGRILDRDETTAVLIDLRWERFAPVFHAKRPTALFSEIPEAVRALARGAGDGDAEPATAGEAADGLRARLAGVPRAEQERGLLELVRSHAGVVMGHVTLTGNARDAVAPDRPFRDLGFDSLMAVELRNRVGAATGVALPATLVFDHPTPEAVARHLRQEMGLGDADGIPPGFPELERLEAALAAAPADDEARARLAKRLERLLWTVSGDDLATTPGEGSGDREFSTVSNDEMFDLIDRELGA